MPIWGNYNEPHYCQELALKITIPMFILFSPAPPKPSKKEIPEVLTKTTSSVKVQFKKNLFSDENGQVIGYAVIVSEDDNKDSSLLELPGTLPRWKDVQSYNTWPAYQV